jgi:hypothetical protein
MNISLTSVDRGEYPAKPYFSSKREKAVFLFMIAVNIAVVGYWLIFLTWGGQ